MNTLHDHYRLLLGLNDSWAVDDVDLDLSGNQVTIQLNYCGSVLKCPECSQSCSQADTAPERTWRHLDTMQFKTEIRAAVPRSRCQKCGVKTITVPWAGKHSRFTLLFEAVAIKVLLASSSIQKAAELLGLSWDCVQTIMQRAVERGLLRRKCDEVEHVGVDEKSFGKGHDYITLLTDLDGHRVLDVAPQRTKAACDELWQTMAESQRKRIKSISLDMWQPFMASSMQHAPQAELVHDRFHVSKHLNEAVDRVRRRENRSLQADGDGRLKGTRQLWLYNQENLDEDRYHELLTAQRSDLKTGRAWAIKENFRLFWSQSNRLHGKRFFEAWYSWAIRSRLDPIKKTARMLKTHSAGLFSYFSHRVTNAITEGFNSRIQSLKSAARGFRNFTNYRIRILFFCGKLNLQPELCH